MKRRTISQRTGVVLIGLAVVASAAIAILGSIAIVQRVVKVFNPPDAVQVTVKCQDSPPCRVFVHDEVQREIRQALQRRSLVHLGHPTASIPGGGQSSGSPPVSPTGGGPSAAPPSPSTPPHHPPSGGGSGGGGHTTTTTTTVPGSTTTPGPGEQIGHTIDQVLHDVGGCRLAPLLCPR